MKELLLLINPHAGKGAYSNGLGKVLLNFHKAGYRTTVAFTDKRGDAPEIAAQQAGKFDRIVCVGGDGTLGETVSGLMRLPHRPPLGYIPMGTTNDCAATLGISHDPVAASYVAVSDNIIPMDIGLINGEKYFTYVAAFGAFTDVSYETSQDQKNALGWLAYVLQAVGRIPKLTHQWTKVEYDTGTLEDDYIFGAVTNSRSIAGLIHLNERIGVSLSDGLFEVILIRTPESPIQLGTIVTDILANKFDNAYVTLLHCTHVRFTFREPVAWSLDGDNGGEHSVVECENIPQAVQIAVGKKKGAE